MRTERGGLEARPSWPSLLALWNFREGSGAAHIQQVFPGADSTSGPRIQVRYKVPLALVLGTGTRSILRHGTQCPARRALGDWIRGVRFHPKPRPSSSLRAVLQQGHPHGPYRGCSERCTASARGHREGAPRPHPSPSPPLPSRPRTPSVGDCSLADSTPQQAALSIMLSITASLQSMDGGPPTALAAGLGRAGAVP